MLEEIVRFLCRIWDNEKRVKRIVINYRIEAISTDKSRSLNSIPKSRATPDMSMWIARKLLFSLSGEYLEMREFINRKFFLESYIIWKPRMNGSYIIQQ